MAMSKMFHPEQKTMPGSVVINEIDNPFRSGEAIMHVVRNTADDAVIASEMTKFTDIVKANDMVPVMNAFVEAVKALVERGNAVRISGLGTFYIKAVKDENSKNTSTAESMTAGSGTKGASISSTGAVNSTDSKGITLDGTTFTVGFTVDRELCKAAAKNQAKTVQSADTTALVESVENMDSMEENTLTSGKAALIKGRRLRIAGCTDGGGALGSINGAPMDGTGLFIVPCDGYGNYKTDKSDWVRVRQTDIKKNTMTQVLFRVPAGLQTGMYRIGISTRAPLSGSTKEELLIKKARCSVSRMFEMQCIE